MIIWPFIEGCEGFSLTFTPYRAEYLTQMPSDKHQPAQRCSGGSAECRRSAARRERGSTSHQFREAVSTAIMERRFSRVFFPSHGSTTKKIHRNERSLFCVKQRCERWEVCSRVQARSSFSPTGAAQRRTKWHSADFSLSEETKLLLQVGRLGERREQRKIFRKKDMVWKLNTECLSTCKPS